MSSISNEWIAGFFDGEGTICLSQGNPGNWCTVVSIAQKIKQPLVDIQQKFGGKFYEVLRGSSHVWRLTWTRKEDIERILSAILPYLRVKQLQVLTMFAFLATSKGPGWNGRLTPEVRAFREQLEINLKRLNHK